MCREWAHRAEYYFLLWHEAGESEDYPYSDVALKSYVPTMSWVEWATRQEIDLFLIHI